MTNLPAILGGTPAFAKPLPFIRPTLPPSGPLEAVTREILGNGQLTKGRYLQAFERAVAEHLGVKHAVGVSSCTSGLILTYQALGLKGEVIVPSFTFMATVSALVWAGATPVFVDVDEATGTIDPAAVERAITPRTEAIVAVHTFGNPADIDELENIARMHHLKLVFDAAHGFGATYQGAPIGGQGDANIFSLSPTKLLVAGEGGIVATNDDALAEHVRLGREYGNDGSYDSRFAGLNARMSEFNAALGLESLKILESVAATHNRIADSYRMLLSSVRGIRPMTVREGNRCSYKDFSLVVSPEVFGLTRDQLADALKAENIDTRKYYWPPVHRQTAYIGFASDDAALPHTNDLADNSLSLPIGSAVDDASLIAICRAIARIHESAAAIRERFEASPAAPNRSSRPRPAAAIAAACQS